MSAVCLSSLEDRLCVSWTAEIPMDYDIEVESDTFSFQNRLYRLEFFSQYFEDDDYTLRLSLVEGLVTGPFIVTVLVEKRVGDEPTCQTLACERVSELPWKCTFDQNCFDRHSSFFFKNGEEWVMCRFIIIFEEDPTSVSSGNTARSVQTACAVGNSKSTDFPPSLDNLSLDFANLLKNETLPDVKLNCGGRDRAIPAHRAVLAARSEVFAAMFRNEMAESRTGDVDVPDVEEDVIDPFLQYVYSGQIPSGVPDEVVPGLYAAADKYAVHTLRETCRDRMVSCLTEENCVDFLTVADAHGDDEFKKSVVDYICSHKAVFKGDAWREFAKKQPLLAIEVYQSKVERET